MSRFTDDDFFDPSSLDTTYYQEEYYEEPNALIQSPKPRETRLCTDCGMQKEGDLDRVNGRVFYCWACWDYYNSAGGLPKRQECVKRRNCIQRELERHGKFLDKTKIEVQLSKQNWSQAAVLAMYMKQFGLQRRKKPVQPPNQQRKPIQAKTQSNAVPQLNEPTPLPAPPVEMAKGMSDISSFMGTTSPSRQKNKTESRNYSNTGSGANEEELLGKDLVSPGMVKSRSEAKSPQDALKTSGSIDQAVGEKLLSERAFIKKAKQRSQLVEERVSKKKKPNINLVVVGHVDAGKSTLMGHLLLKLGAVSKKEIHQNKKAAVQHNKESFALAYIMDSHEEERSRGITVDVCLRHFETPNRKVTLLDSPGHRDFIPNMIAGASQAECAILVCPAQTGEFESGFEDGGQTKEHAVLIQSLGVKQVILAVNKMDTVGWNEERYNEIVELMLMFLKKVGYSNKKKVRTLPISGFTGENLTEPCSDCTWYTGPTLIEMIDTLKKPNLSMDKPLRMSISDVYKTQDLGPCIAGKIETGSVMEGDQIYIRPANILTTVKRIQTVENERVSVGLCGENVQLGLKFDDISKLIVGNVVCDPTKPISLVTKFEAKIYTLETQMNRPILKGSEVMLFVGNREVPAVISKLKKELGKSDEVIKEKPRHLFGGKRAIVNITIQDDQSVCLETYETIKNFGRIMLRRSQETIAVGQVISLKKMK